MTPRLDTHGAKMVVRNENIQYPHPTSTGRIDMPLDTTLKWIDLTHAERAQLRDQIGAERLHAIPLPCDYEA